MDSASTSDQHPILSRHKRPPALPVEVIERILSFIFLSETPLTPSSDPFHLHNTTHVLLVSRAFRLLALPLLYHTVILSRPSHYSTFFDPSHGLFTAGTEGQTRWSLVRELGLVLGVEPPAASSPVLPRLPRADGLIVPLALPASPTPLPIFCLLRQRLPTSELSEIWDLGVDHLGHLARADPTMREAIHREMYHAWATDPVDSDWPLEQIILEQTGLDVEAAVEED